MVRDLPEVYRSPDVEIPFINTKFWYWLKSSKSLSSSETRLLVNVFEYGSFPLELTVC